MKAIINVLTRVFVVQFYQSHISLFLFVLGMSAGFMRAEDHIALGTSIISSPLLTLIPIIVWLVYSLIVIKFNGDLLSHPENRFIYTLAFVDKKKQYTSIMYAILLQMIPVVFYAGFLVSLAWEQRQYPQLIEIGLSVAALITICSAFLFIRVKHFREYNDPWRLTILINQRFVKPFPLFFPEWMARKELFVLMGTKVCGLLLIFATAQLYKFDTYDVRLIAMAVVLAFAAQSHLVWNLHYFENHVMSMTRNLPLGFPKRFANLLATLFVLLLPESAFLISRFPKQLGIYDLISSLSVGWSVCILFYGFLYTRSFILEALTTRIFFFVIALLMLILFKVPLLLISSLLLSTGSCLWMLNYYKFEGSIRS